MENISQGIFKIKNIKWNIPVVMAHIGRWPIGRRVSSIIGHSSCLKWNEIWICLDTVFVVIYFNISTWKYACKILISCKTPDGRLYFTTYLHWLGVHDWWKLCLSWVSEACIKTMPVQVIACNWRLKYLQNVKTTFSN